MAHEELCPRLRQGFAAGERFLGCTSSLHTDAHGAPLCFDAQAASMASELCAEAQTMPRHVPGAQPQEAATAALRLVPEQGTAIFFFPASPAPEDSAAARDDDGNPVLLPDPELWHGSCRVRRGEKWTMQQFKELLVPAPQPNLDA